MPAAPVFVLRLREEEEEESGVAGVLPRVNLGWEVKTLDGWEWEKGGVFVNKKVEEGGMSPIAFSREVITAR